MKKAIVTGANGFVGAAICRELSAQGVQIIAVVKNEESDTSSIKTYQDCDYYTVIYLNMNPLQG